MELNNRKNEIENLFFDKFYIIIKTITSIIRIIAIVLVIVVIVVIIIIIAIVLQLYQSNFI